MALQLLRPIDALLLPPGQTARAEVLASTLKGSEFELLLRVMQNAGAPAQQLVATSPRAVSSGAQLMLQAISQTQLMAVLQPAAKAPTAELITRLDPALFPPGSAVQAQVVSQQAISQGEQQRFAIIARLLQGAASGSTLNLTSAKPLEPGTLITALVGSQGELRVPDPARQQVTLAILQGLRDSLQRQGSSEPLFKSLEQLSQVATPPAAGAQGPSATAPAMPASVQNAMHQVLQQVASLQQLMTPAGVAQAVQRSGVFLEPNLAQLAGLLKGASAETAALAAGTGTGTTQPPALGKLLAALSSLPVSPATPPLPGADLKAALLHLTVNLQQHLSPSAIKELTLPFSPWKQNSGGPAQQGFPVATRVVQGMTDAPDLGALLRLTAALLSRIQHHQLQSLGQSQTFSDGSSQTVWQLEIPLRDGQQFNHVQVRIQRDDTSAEAKQTEHLPHWEVRLAFNLDPLGSLQAIAKLYKGRVSSEFWAEQPQTLTFLHSELNQLRDRLLAKGLEVGELSCHQGTPPQPNRALQQRWIDEVT
ncbi:flagellar hook-length control protein FliK [Halopseudomonas pelagia]|uniref:flagellar hook-length control protein FliK n=1 Tax=Halopseudomonas pelagia TaxID=553151 RepID=UPI0003A4F207|nr:flagellar hook-length control protein FliK [Halopseudomonas pelagia]